MSLVLTAKIRLYPTSEQSDMFKGVTENLQYRKSMVF